VFDSGKVMDRTIDGKPLRMFGTHLDITNRKKSEQQLAETNISLTKAMRVKDEFMAAMSHELRTPLTGILGVAEMLQMNIDHTLTEKQLKYVTTIEQSGQRLLKMVNNVLEFTQLQGDAPSPELSRCKLVEVCKAAMNITAPSATAKQQVTHLASNPYDIEILTDKGLLSKILTLLLDNASKFTPTGGKFGIDITRQSDTGLVNITVWDTGIGVAEDNLPRLFTPFTQLDASLSRQFEGSGLSLALVKSMTELLGGTVSVQSKLEEGSHFIITLPWK